MGVWITDNLKPSMQCQCAYSKASRALGLIGRTISFKSKDVLIRLYKTLRPHLEYCVSAWSPYCVKDRLLLERVQHRFTRMVPGFKNLPCEKRLEHLGLWTLEGRRNRADLLCWMFSKCTRDCRQYLLNACFHSVIQLLIQEGQRPFSQAKHHCHLDLRRYFFSDRWNNLSRTTVAVTSTLSRIV